MARAEIESGVIATPVPISAGSSVHIIYRGPLAKRGAQQVYLHTGFGPASGWEKIHEYPMSPSKWGWETVIDVHGEEQDRFNFCFRDSTDNWDNNNGRNWGYELQK